MNPVAEKLRAARKLIERGWVQGHFEKWNDNILCFCAMGAILEVADEGGLEGAAVWQPLSTAVGSNIFSWNDAPGRTQSEVLAAFDRAIEIAEAGQ